MPEFLGAP